MPKLPSSGPPRLHSPGSGASPHVGRRPSPLSRSASQTNTVLELKGSIEQTDEISKFTVVASITPSQPPSTDITHSADLGHQSAPNIMHIVVDCDPLPPRNTRIPSVPQDNHGQSKLPTSTGPPAPEDLGRQYDSSVDVMDTDPPPLQNTRIPFAPQAYGQNKLSGATGPFNQATSQALPTYTGPPAPKSVQTGFQVPYSIDQSQLWGQSQGQSQRQNQSQNRLTSGFT